MSTKGTTVTMAVLLVAILGIWWLLEDRSIPAHRFPEWTPAEKQAINKAIRKHGNFTAHRTAEGVYLKTDRGVVWIERAK